MTVQHTVVSSYISMSRKNARMSMRRTAGLPSRTDAIRDLGDSHEVRGRARLLNSSRRRECTCGPPAAMRTAGTSGPAVRARPSRRTRPRPDARITCDKGVVFRRHRHRDSGACSG